MARTPCAICGSAGVAEVCSGCHREVCAKCAVPRGEAAVCSSCAAEAETVTRAHAERTALAPEIARIGGGSTDWLTSLQRAFVFIRESTGMVVRDKDLLVPAALSVMVSIAILAIIVATVIASGGTTWLTTIEEQRPYVLYAMVAVVMLVSYMVTFFFNGMTVNLVDVHLKGGDARLGEAFADAWKNVLALVWLAVVSTLVSAATSALRGRRRSGLGDLAADAVDKAWSVATYLLVPIIIIEDCSLREATARAKDLHQRNLVPILVGEVGVSLATGLIGFVGMMVAFGLAYMALQVGGGGASLPALVLAVAIAGLAWGAVMAWTLFIRTAYYTCLFLWAAETETAGAGARVPAPLARALA
jgi:membrane-anchored glycerophosphoryl diester phosphodiesterase (GDPDase)